MKKFLTSCIALLLVFSTPFIFTGCKKDNGKTKIEFDKGVYGCTLDEENFTVNEELSHAEIDSFLNSESNEFSDFNDYIIDFAEIFENTYIELSDYAITMYNYEIDENMFLESYIKFDEYTFKNNVLSFSELDAVDYKITKNADNTLTLKLEESYDFSETEVENIKVIFTAEIILTINSEANPVIKPTPELNLYQNKTINKKYSLTALSNMDNYFAEYSDLFAMVGINTVEEFTNYTTNNSNGTLVIFNDFTMYYEANIDLDSMFSSIMGDMDMGYEMNYRVGYIYSYQPSEEVDGAYDAMNSKDTIFTFEILNNGANINVTVEDFLSDTSYTLNFTEIVEAPQQ